MKVRLYLEIDDLAIDENGNAAPAGLCIAFDVSDLAVFPTDYQELVQSIKKEDILRLTGLDGLAELDDVRFITREEYEQEYGDEEQEGQAVTIEEAIAHAREVAEGCTAEDRQCAYQHDKLADWLEELKAYRETGLTPEEITALQASNREIKKEALPLMQAKIQDRLVVLPCKVTDTVYVVETVFENGKQKRRNKPSGEQVVSAQIDHVTIGGTTGKPVFDLCTETGNWYKSMERGDFYLTAEEAEKAMKER